MNIIVCLLGKEKTFRSIPLYRSINFTIYNLILDDDLEDELSDLASKNEMILPKWLHSRLELNLDKRISDNFNLIESNGLVDLKTVHGYAARSNMILT